MRKDVLRGRRVGLSSSGRAGWVERLEGRQLLTAASVATLPNVVASAAGDEQAIDLGAYFKDSAVPANTVFVQTTLGTIPVQLTPGVTPLTVANFMNYVSSGRYDGSFFHRSVPGFVVQGGGYAVEANQVEPVDTDAPVQNEPGQSNVRGTIAMAKLGGDPDSATSQFFFSLANNSTNLDNQNGGFTVFGNVLGQQGLAVMDSIAAVPVVNAGNAFSDLPVIGFQNGQSSISLNQLVYINSVTTGAAFKVNSDNPDVLAVSVRDSRLLYQAKANGVAHVTVTAAGLDGATVSQTFTVIVGSDVSADNGETTPAVKVGNGGVKSVTFKDKDGTVATITVSGPGSATVNLDGTNVDIKTSKGVATVTGTNVSVGSILMDGATGRTVVTVTTKGGNGMVDVGGVLSAGTMGTLTGTGVNLVGTTVVGGTLKNLTVKSAAKGSSISAASVGTFTVSGNSLADVTVSGSVGNVAVAGTLGKTWRVGSVKVLNAGALTRASVATTGLGKSLGMVTVKTMKGSQLRSAGGIKSVVVTGGMAASQVFAGVPADGDVTAEDAAGGTGTILSLKVGSGPKGNAFANSAVAAKTIRSAVMGNIVDTASAAAFYGIEADSIVSMTGYISGKAFAVNGAGTQAQLDAQLAKAKVTPKKVKLVVV